MDAQLLPVRSLKPHPLNPRFDLGDISALTEDIREAGVIQALTVMPGSRGKETGECRDCEQTVDRVTTGVLVEHYTNGSICPGGSEPAGDEWFIIAGHRRRAAAQAAGLTHVPAVVRWDIKGKRDVVLTMLRENIHRRDLTALEELKGYEQLELEGLTATRIAQQTRQSKAHVDRRLALQHLPKASRTALKAGKLDLNEAYGLLNLPAESEARALKSVGTKSFRQEVAREHLSLVKPPTDEEVADKLRRDFLATVAGGLHPLPDVLPVKQEIVAALARSLPNRTVRAWVTLLGTDEKGIRSVNMLNALLGLATVLEADSARFYDLLDALGYVRSPVEEALGYGMQEGA